MCCYFQTFLLKLATQTHILSLSLSLPSPLLLPIYKLALSHKQTLFVYCNNTANDVKHINQNGYHNQSFFFCGYIVFDFGCNYIVSFLSKIKFAVFVVFF